MTAAGGDGAAFDLDAGFVVLTGVECSAPRVAGGLRQDELEKTDHVRRYADDLRQIASFGMRYVRYGIPFHRVAADPSRLDWEWTDRALDAVWAAGLEPIADLLHFGVPDDLDGVADPRLPDRYRAYVEAFADRYPSVRYYTPVNEPLVCSVMSGGLGWWNERQAHPAALVAAIDRLAECAVIGSQAIRERRADAIFLQSDACEVYLPVDDAARERTDFLNARRFVAYDLVYGREPAPAVVDWLMEHGMSAERLAWFGTNGTDAGCMIGLDYYSGNEWDVTADGRSRAARRRRGFARLARDYHARYGLPFMLSETNTESHRAVRWLAETWDDSLQLLDEGLPLRGFCWYGFVNHVDWDSGLRRNRGHENLCGLVDLERRPQVVADVYRGLVAAADSGELALLGSPASRRYRREDLVA